MRIVELFLDELEREAEVSRRAIERVPDGKNDWKPHEKSMTLGNLARLVAEMPSWIPMTINQDEFDLNPGGEPTPKAPGWRSRLELIELLENSVRKAREVLVKTTDEHLMSHWKLLFNGRVVIDDPRYIVIRDTVFNHAAHHRGQLTVYLRLLNVSVPAVYGPSADENSFADAA